MSITVAPRFARTETRPGRGPSALAGGLIRIGSFAALGAYGILRWRTLLSPAPSGRLLGLLALAVAVVALIPLLRRLGTPPAIVAAALMSLLALPLAGLGWHDFLHLRLAVGARHIGDGLAGLPGSFVPYSGQSHDIRTVISLGAAVLLLDAAIMLAFAPPVMTDTRRAGAALPLIALAVVPSTLLRPQLPYLQGLILFLLLVAFVWGERAQLSGRRAALAVLIVAGVLGAVIAPRLDAHHAWLDYRSWTGNLTRGHVDEFAWNQHYGPLHWPRSGHVVLTVQAQRGDYWKAEDLDVFDGYGWSAGPVRGIAPPSPSSASLIRWSEPIEVTLRGMTSSAVIGAGYAGAPSLAGGAAPGAGAGTWTSYRPLGPGTRYRIDTYSPHPTPAALARAGARYPEAALAAYQTLTIPEARVAAAAYPQLTFAPFRAGRGPAVAGGDPDSLRLLRASPYGRVFALARRLRAGTRTPYAYAMAIVHYLDGHYTYRENTPARRYPLVSFLFRDRIGYCQQFSGAMAMLLRMGGVPARVAAGFTTGTQDHRGRFVVTDIDAHAWDEAWFPGYGWVRFDPTPAVAPARGGGAALPVVKNLPGEGSIRSGAGSRRQSLSLPSQNRPRAGGGQAGASPWLLLPAGLLVILGGLLIGSLLRPAPGPEAELRELERALARSGRPIGPEVTLAALEHRFRDAPAVAEYLRGLRLARYGARPVSPVPGGRRALREQLRRGLGVTGRLRVLWALPPRLRRRQPGH